ncbi:MAG: hypothetical protein WCI74_07405, partial [Actinomycetes bacterium]
MSTDLVYQVLTQSTAQASARLVLIELAHFTGERGCRVNIKTLAQAAGLKRIAVMDAIAKLEMLGELNVIRVNGACNRYEIVLQTSAESAPVEGSTSAEFG